MKMAYPMSCHNYWYTKNKSLYQCNMLDQLKIVNNNLGDELYLDP